MGTDYQIIGTGGREKKWQGDCFYQLGRQILDKKRVIQKEITKDVQSCALLCEDVLNCEAFEYESQKRDDRNKNCIMYKEGILSGAERIEKYAGICTGKYKLIMRWYG